MGCVQAQKSQKPTQSIPKSVHAPEPPLPAHEEDIAATYVIGNVINNGKFGVVRQGHLRSDPTQKVAIKSIDKTSSNTNPEHLRREIENLERVKHPNVMKLYNVYMDPQYIHLVTELCTGGELFDRMLKKGRFDEVEAAHVMRMVLLAVEHLHSLNIVHRDLKPENFMFLSPDPNSPLKLIDFGFSKKLENTTQQVQTMVGTPSYVSPELLTGTYGPESDLWSCGVILYTILAGRYPFYDEDEQKIYQQVKRGAFALDEATWGNISEEAKDLVRHLLEKDPTKRFTATQALGHEWFRKTEGPLITLEQSLIDTYNLLKINSRLQRETMLFLVHNFTLAEIRDFRSIFQDVDTGNTNELTPNEIKRAIMTKAPPSTIPELESLFGDVPGLVEGKVNYMNLLEASKACKVKMYEEMVWGIFKKKDARNTGLIPVSEIKNIFKDLQKPLTDEEFQQRLREASLSPTGTATFEEFKSLLLRD